MTNIVKRVTPITRLLSILGQYRKIVMMMREKTMHLTFNVKGFLKIPPAIRDWIIYLFEILFSESERQ